MPFEFAHQPAAGANCRWGPGTVFGHGVVLGEGVVIGANCVIGDKVEIGPGTFVGNCVVMGEPTRAFYQNPGCHQPLPTRIGPRSAIRSGTIIYEGVDAGEGLETGNHATLREGCRIGRHVRIGSHSDLQGALTVGDYVSLHSNVHLGQHTVVEDYAWLFPYVITINDRMPPVYFEELGVHIGQYAVVGANTFLHPGVILGVHSVIAARSVVQGDVPDFAFAKGDPAKVVTDSRKLHARRGAEVVRAYPWPAHVFVKANPITGQLVVADLVLAPDQDPEQAEARIRTACSEHLAPHQVPRIMRFVADLTPSDAQKLSRTSP
ncbi:MAG: hypothetical protein FJZ00_07510 [Candidatus Sericytochromatia bacterium]|uniref:N-acetyltransferase n=1 Tax=Candidatus Tanganyikabacteria bacterium TaxID=2961651 RepID=A0A938BN49_9BACT|nr:hypothetical protein [Candidatus Tanganyikabacteria bacterium]